MLTGKARHLRYFSLSHLVSVDSTDANALLVDMQHNPSRLFGRLIEEALEHVDDEVHRRVVVVEKQHLVQARPLRLRTRLGDDLSAGVAAPASVTVPPHRPH